LRSSQCHDKQVRSSIRQYGVMWVFDVHCNMCLDSDNNTAQRRPY